MSDKKYIRVRYVKSSIGYSQRQKDTVKGLGLRKLGQEKTHEANDSILGQGCTTLSSVGRSRYPGGGSLGLTL